MPRVPTSKHGAWSLPVGADADRRIRACLFEGTPAHVVADVVGVALDYVEQMAREMRDEQAVKRAAIPRPPAPEPGEPLEARSQVDCIVAGAVIGARACVDRQGAERCFCPRAIYAVNALAPLAIAGSKLREALDRCRSVVLSMHSRPADERYLGDALAAHQGRAVEARPLIAGELPAPPRPEERATRKPLITARVEPVDAEPELVSEPTLTAPRAPEESKTMPKDLRPCSVPGCTHRIHADNKIGKCKVHGKAERQRAYRAARKGEAAPARAPVGKPAPAPTELRRMPYTSTPAPVPASVARALDAERAAPTPTREVYAAVIADLEAKRALIDTAISTLRLLAA